MRHSAYGRAPSAPSRKRWKPPRREGRYIRPTAFRGHRLESRAYPDGVGVQAKSLGAGIVMIAGPARQQPEILSAKAASRCRCVDTKDGTDRSPAKGARHQDRAKAAAARIGWSGRSISFVRPVYVDRVVQPVAHKSCGHDRIRATDWLAGRILGRAVQITATDAARRGRCQCWADGLEVRRARS